MNLIEEVKNIDLMMLFFAFGAFLGLIAINTGTDDGISYGLALTFISAALAFLRKRSLKKKAAEKIEVGKIECEPKKVPKI